MELTRRSLFKTLLGGLAAASVLDPEKLLWKAGERKIFVPPVSTHIVGIDLAHGPDQTVIAWFGGDTFQVGDIVRFSHSMNPWTRCLVDVPRDFRVTREANANGLTLKLVQ